MPPTASSPRPTGRPWVRLAGGVGAVVVVASLAGCGLRLETPPPPLPSPGVAETARQGASTRADALATLARSAVGEGAVAAALGRVADDAAAHLATLGGVWTPPAWADEPDLDASGSPTARASATPTASTAPTARARPEDVLAAVVASALLTCADAVAVADPDLAALLASICLAQEDEGRDLAAAAAAATPGPVRPAPTTDAAGLAEAVGAVDGALDLARALDAAGFALEVAAARATGADRDALAARAAEHRTQAHALVAAAGALGTPADPRRAAYDLGVADPAGALGPAAAVETDVLAAWAAVFGDAPATARAGVLDAMAEALLLAEGWGAPSSAFPGLPDLRP